MFEHVFRAFPDPLLMLDRQGRILDANNNILDITGMSRTALQRMKFTQFCNNHGDLVRAFEKAAHEVAMVRIRDVQLHLGNQLQLFELVTFMGLLGDENGVVVTFRSAGSGLEAGYWGNKNVEMGAYGMAAILSHEVKNPLSGIRGAAQLLASNANAEDRELCDLITTETDRITRLLDRLNILAEDDGPPKTALNIHEVIDKVLQIYSMSDWPKLNILRAFDPSLPPVLGHGDSLVQVFLNLVKNAGEAMGENGTLRIETNYRTGIRVQRGKNSSPNLPIEVRVVDVGPGVPSELAKHLFTPFVGAREGGAGLGLAIVAKLVNQHEGFVEYRRVGHESVFAVRLPRAV